MKPVLLVKGQGTEPYNVAITDALAGSLPDVRVVELPGGHMAAVVSMDRFLAEVEGFRAAPPRPSE